MPLTPQTLQRRYAPVLKGFAELGYRTSLTLAMRLNQIREEPHRVLPLTLVSTDGERTRLEVELAYQGGFVLRATRSLASWELFRLHNLNKILYLRQRD